MKKTYLLLPACLFLSFVFSSCGGDGRPASEPVIEQPVAPNEPTNVTPPPATTTPPISPVEPPATPPEITIPEDPTTVPVPSPTPPATPVTTLDPSLPQCTPEALELVVHVYGPEGGRTYPFVAKCAGTLHLVWSRGHSEPILAYNQGIFCTDAEFLVKRMDGEFYDLSIPHPSPEDHFPACSSYSSPGAAEYPIGFTPSTCGRISSYATQCNFFLMEVDDRLQVGFSYVGRDDRLFWRYF